MGSARTWSTKEDVLRDLARATGRRVSNLDEDYLVIGARPPPKHAIDDEEAELMFGDELKSLNGTALQNNMKKPDLRGITQMLRMVNECAEGGTKNDSSSVLPNQTMITISKLNPDVQDFVPKTAKSVKNENIEVSSNNTGNKNLKTNGTGSKTTSNDKESLESNDKMRITDNQNSETNIDLSITSIDKQNDDKIKKLADVLRDKICDASQLDTFENKRRKNVAISALLKLYTTKTPSAVIKHEVKLMTPQDFECTKQTHATPVGNVITPNEKSILDKEYNSPPVKNVVTSHRKSPLDEGYKENKAIKLTPSTCTSSITPNENNTTASSSKSPLSPSPIPTKTEVSPKNHINPEIKASIDKVNKWLDEPVTKKKDPPIYLGPITYKVKEKPANATPPPQPTYQNTCTEYKPSNYAMELAKKYMENSEKKKEVLKRDPWTNLDVILRERDEQIMKKRRQKAAAACSPMSTTSTNY